MDFERLLDVVLPSTCSLCGKPPSMLCEGCLGSLNLTCHRVERFGMLGFAATEFDAQVSKLVSAFKEHSRRALASKFAAAIAGPAFNDYLHELGFAGQGQALLLVGAPSSPKSLRKRGYLPAHELARALEHRLKATLGYSTDVRALEGLRLVRAARDQAGLPAHERSSNLSQSMVANETLKGQRVLLVDDIVTTGSTMVEAQRALAETGAVVVGFVVFSETLLKSSARS